MNNTQGVSLPEMMVALFLSSLIILILTTQYLGMKRYYQQTEKKIAHALEWQLIIDLIRDSTRQAGFTPCMNIDKLTTADTRFLPKKWVSIDVQSGIHLNHMSAQYGHLIQQISSTSWLAAADVSLSPQLPVLISDCYHAEIHTLEKMRGSQEIHLKEPMKYTYVPPIYIGQWLEEHFYSRSEKLFYQLGHVDVLSTLVNDLSASLYTQHGERFVHTILRIDAEKDEIVFDTLLRVG